MKPSTFWSLAAVAFVALAAQIGSRDDPAPAGAPLGQDQREQFATLINLNGRLCAAVVDVQLRQDGRHYVECEESRGSIRRAAYYVDTKTGKVE